MGRHAALVVCDFCSVLMQRSGPADMIREQSSFSSHSAQKPLLYIPAPAPFSLILKTLTPLLVQLALSYVSLNTNRIYHFRKYGILHTIHRNPPHYTYDRPFSPIL